MAQAVPKQTLALIYGLRGERACFECSFKFGAQIGREGDTVRTVRANGIHIK